ncbi:MAG: CidA/LrgA family protein [Lautropia sp.]|nr:CidA/LrgA family protein [Lautropia sp.]
MLNAITILLIFQLAGEIITQAFQLPIPGPVIGMVLLFITLVLRGGPGKALRETSGTLLQYLSMLFIPAGAGVMLHFGTLRAEWLPILLAATLGTALVIVITALLLQALIRRQDGADARTAERHPDGTSHGGHAS